MRPISAEELRALGIDPGITARPIARDAPPDDHVGRGFTSGGSEALTDEALRRLFASRTEVAAFDETASRIGAPEATIARADRSLGVFQLALEGLDVMALGDARLLDDVWYVDSRAEPVVVRARGVSGDCLLRFEGPMFEWYDLPTAASPAMISLEGYTPAATPAVVPPSADALLGGFDAPAWMTSALESAPPEDPFAVCSAVGTIGRLWAPRGTSTSPADALERLMADDDPMARAARWFASLAGEVHVALGELACVEATTLADALDALVERVADDCDEARDEALAWLEGRDDLASVEALLRPLQSSPLAVALVALDRAGGVHATMWRALSPLGSPRLEAAGWQEPDAWWAAPARAE